MFAILINIFDSNKKKCNGKDSVTTSFSSSIGRSNCSNCFKYLIFVCIFCWHTKSITQANQEKTATKLALCLYQQKYFFSARYFHSSSNCYLENEKHTIQININVNEKDKRNLKKKEIREEKDYIIHFESKNGKYIGMEKKNRNRKM